MIMKLLQNIYNYFKRLYIKRKRRKLIIRALESRCVTLRYTLINLCMSYTNDGMKQSRFLYRVDKTARLLKRRELHLKALRKRL